MPKKQTRMWVPTVTKPTFDNQKKSEIVSFINDYIKTSSKLSKKVTRIEMRANRIYLYELVEQFITKGAVYIKPLIDDKYLEFPYARITINDKGLKECTADWQRHNEQWISLHSGTLEKCLNDIENDGTWF